MSTLIISYQYPLPEIGGNRIRTMNFVRYFKQFGEVDIIYSQERTSCDDSDSVFRNEFFIDLGKDSKKQNKVVEIYERLRYSKPWIVCNFTEQSVREHVELIERGDYEHIICRYAVSAYPLNFISKGNKNKVIVDIDDLITPDLYAAVYGTLPGINKIKSLLDMRMFRNYQHACAKIGKALVCSEHDKELIMDASKSTEVYMVPNIAPETTLPETYNIDGYQNLGTFLFVGNLAYKPNVQGLVWFVEELFSRLLTRAGELKLIIIGKDPDPQIQLLCQKYAEIELIENPPEVVSYYERCGAVVVPLLTGGGTRIKILEAGRAWRPVISTPIGGHGLSLCDRREILFMEDLVSFKAQTEWLTVRSNYDSLVNSMNSYVENNFTRKQFESAMAKVTGLESMPLKDKVSAIMPVYNREVFLAAAIESVLNQTYGNIELIIVDDGSTDNSLEIAQKYRAIHPDKIKILTQKNQGPSKARNSGIRLAEGDLVAFIDSDDIWAPEKIELQLNMFKRYGNASFIYSGYYIVNKDGDITTEVQPDKRMKGNILEKLWTVENSISGGTLLVPKEKLVAVGCFDEDLKGGENLDLRIKLSKLGDVYYVDKPLYYYRKHGDNLTSQLSTMDEAHLQLINKHFSQNNNYDELLFRRVMSEYYFNIGVNHFSNSNLHTAMPYFCKAIIKTPYKIKYYVRLLRCCLGVRVNSLISRLKQLIVFDIAYEGSKDR